ncbi:methyltransferase domain-containing protein [Bacillus sonorensis]|nr:methyltransferase domain-containing protein [Bacillus sonorensis]
MLDLLTEHHPEAEVIGIDLSVNVIEELQKRKVREHKPWKVKQADALDLPEYIEKESVDTIVFSSILHELFSYIPYEGRKFNHRVIAKALTSSFDVLRPKGRIIIRDGIMTEDKEEVRRIRFKDPDGMAFLGRYVRDFKGRQIEILEIEKDAALLYANDAMEFLYTYTWGKRRIRMKSRSSLAILPLLSFGPVLRMNWAAVRISSFLSIICKKGMRSISLPKLN